MECIGSNWHIEGIESPKTKDIIKGQIIDLFCLNNIRLMFRLWNELDSPVKPELNKMIQQYHRLLMKNGWNVFYGINALYFTGQTIFAWCFLRDEDNIFGYFKYLFPILIVALSIFDIIIKKSTSLLVYVFIVFMLIMGVSITHENLIFDEFKIYEVWPMYYFY